MVTTEAHRCATEGPPNLSGPPIPQGIRNRSLVEQAGRWRWQGYTGDTIARALSALNRARCCPPLPHAEVLAIGRWIAKKPAGPGRRDGVSRAEWDATRDELVNLFLLLDSTPFPGRRGATERDLIGVLLNDAWRTGRMEPDASWRWLADHAGINRRTVARHLSGRRRLPASLARWVERVRPGQRACVRTAAGEWSTRGTRWRVRPFAVVVAALQAAGIELSLSVTTQGKVLGGECSLVTHRDSAPGHDAWRFGGLGKQARRVFATLREAPARSAGALAVRLAIARPTAYRALAKLALAGLVARTPAGWCATSTADDGRVDAVAATLPTAGRAARQRAQHAAERAAFCDPVAIAMRRARAAGRLRLRLRDADGAAVRPVPEEQAAPRPGARTAGTRPPAPPHTGPPPAAPPESWR